MVSGISMETTIQPTPSKKDEKNKKKKAVSDEGNDAITIEDLVLPKSIMNRLAKAELPIGTQIQSSAMTAISRGTTVFISHLSAAANDNAKSSGKKIIMPADVFKALEDTEFGFMKRQLEQEFARYTELQVAKRSKKKPTGDDKKGAEASGDTGSHADADASKEGPAGESKEDAPRTKKARIDVVGAQSNGGDNVEEEDEEDIVEDEVVSNEEEEKDEEEGENEEEEEEEEEEENGDDDEQGVVDDDLGKFNEEDPEVVEGRLQRKFLEDDVNDDDSD